MDLVIIGQPTITGIKVNGELLADSQPCRDDSKAFRLTQSHDARTQEAMQVNLIHALGSDRGNLEEAIIIQPLQGSRRRKARKRGWARLRIATMDTSFDRGLCGYLLFDRNGKGMTMMLCRRPDTASFMGILPDETSIADLSLPGTHDTCAFYGVPVSQCQQPATPLAEQLLDGVRFLDIRLRVVKSELIVYHGERNQRTTFIAVLADLLSFLASHPTETVIMSLKDEKRHEDFSRLLWLDMVKHKDIWFLENRVPTLGEVRGKAIIMGRFWCSPDDDSWENGMGWRIPGWGPPVKDLEFDCGGTKGILQDWYGLSSFLTIPEKLAITTAPLGAPRQADEAPKLTISYASASGYPLAPPYVIAKGFGWPEWGFGVEGINSRLEGWLIRQLRDGKRIKGIVPLDFYRQAGSDDGGAICELLVLFNML